MHCVDPACVERLHARRAPEARDGIVTYDAGLCSAAATARWRARSTSRSSSGRQRAPKIVKCELCNHRLAEGKEPGVHRGLPAPGGDLRQARRPARRGEAADRREPGRTGLREPTTRSTARPTAAARSASTSRTCRSRSSACPTLGDESVAGRCSAPSSTASTRASSRRWRSTALLGVVMFRNREGTGRRPEVTHERARARRPSRSAAALHPAVPRPRRRSSRSAALAIVYRFASASAPRPALNDGYPWGLWIAFDVVTGTALACGGYAVALLVYILNKGQYHPLVRPALLTSALGYTLAGVSSASTSAGGGSSGGCPLFFWHWNLELGAARSRALHHGLHASCCWIELSPAFLEKCRRRRARRPCRRFAATILPDRREGAAAGSSRSACCCRRCTSRRSGSLMLLTGPRAAPAVAHAAAAAALPASPASRWATPSSSSSRRSRRGCFSRKPETADARRPRRRRSSRSLVRLRPAPPRRPRACAASSALLFAVDRYALALLARDRRSSWRRSSCCSARPQRRTSGEPLPRRDADDARRRALPLRHLPRRVHTRARTGRTSRASPRS